nr:glutamine--tRNA ligase/YqeY domain fusion protein [Gammaproteobacteria bacterium]
MTQNASPLDFIRQIVTDDLASDKHGGRVATRFPPEPNGYLHIGHAKSICLNFGVAREFAGQCNLRFDDTNPLREDDEFVDAIQQDVQWLGFEWAGEVKNASDYFEQLYDYAETLISSGLAYVCDLSAEQIREYRGTLTTPGRDSPYRDRSVEENLALFRRMRAGEFKDGSRVLRAKIDMASPNVNMRDPTLYRIRHVSHQRTADAWCIYPMYDYTHCLSDAIEGVTHSLCTLEFADHRPLYDWILDVLPTPCHPQQIEFSRLNLEYTVMSKRLLNLLVTQNYVSGWDDPRMPTISGLRRRGFTAASIREFCARIGVTKKDNVIEMGVLENVVREDLDREAPRAMAVLDPIKLVVDNYPDDLVEEMEAVNHPNRPELGVRTVPFSRELWIERSDFLVNPPKKFHRLGPGREVRLRYGYVVQYASHVENDDGEVTEIHCTYDPQTRGGNTPDGRKVRGTIHWVSAEHAAQAEVRLYDRLFSVPSPGAAVANDSSEAALNEILNPQSLVTVNAAMVE